VKQRGNTDSLLGGDFSAKLLEAAGHLRLFGSICWVAVCNGCTELCGVTDPAAGSDTRIERDHRVRWESIVIYGLCSIIRKGALHEAAVGSIHVGDITEVMRTLQLVMGGESLS